MKVAKNLCLVASLLWVSPALAVVTVEQEAQIFDSYALEHQGDLSAAIKKMTAVFDKDNDNYFVNLRLGWLFSQAKKYKNAIKHYEVAARLLPNSAEPLLGLALVHTNLGDSQQASYYSAKALERDPRNYLGHMRGVAAEIKLKRFTAAASKVDVALKLYPTDPTLLEQKGYSLMQLGKIEEARKVLGDLLLVSPTNGYARAVLAEKSSS